MSNKLMIVCYLQLLFIFHLKHILDTVTFCAKLVFSLLASGDVCNGNRQKTFSTDYTRRRKTEDMNTHVRNIRKNKQILKIITYFIYTNIFPHVSNSFDYVTEWVWGWWFGVKVKYNLSSQRMYIDVSTLPDVCTHSLRSQRKCLMRVYKHAYTRTHGPHPHMYRWIYYSSDTCPEYKIFYRISHAIHCNRLNTRKLMYSPNLCKHFHD